MIFTRMRVEEEPLNFCPLALFTDIIFDDNGETSQPGKIAKHKGNSTWS